MSKLEIHKNIDVFRCPICKSGMKLIDNKSLICGKNHCYDLSRKGYVNFILRPVKTEYSKQLFLSRGAVSSSGFFDPLDEYIGMLIKGFIPDRFSDCIRILDAGCGEGSHLNHIIKSLREGKEYSIEGFGTDLSKDAVQIASARYPECVWCVGDLANNPFQDKKFDVILSILSPSNHIEFKRLLMDNGIIIKVVPGINYLTELRRILYNITDKADYSNEGVVKHFTDTFELIHKYNLNYSFSIDKNTLKHLIEMTPLAWNVDISGINGIYNIKSITVDLLIMCGKSNSKKSVNK